MRQHADVNDKDGVTSLDLLIVINYINSHLGNSSLPARKIAFGQKWSTDERAVLVEATISRERDANRWRTAADYHDDLEELNDLEPIIESLAGDISKAWL